VYIQAQLFLAIDKKLPNYPCNFDDLINQSITHPIHARLQANDRSTKIFKRTTWFLSNYAMRLKNKTKKMGYSLYFHCASHSLPPCFHPGIVRTIRGKIKGIVLCLCVPPQLPLYFHLVHASFIFLHMICISNNLVIPSQTNVNKRNNPHVQAITNFQLASQ